MMRIILLVLSYVFCLTLAGCLSSGTTFRPVDQALAPSFSQKNIKKLAILVRGGSEHEKLQIESGATQALLIHKYIVASRADLKLLDREIKFQRSGLTDSDSAKIAKILGVPAVLVFNFDVKKLDNNLREYEVSARLIDAETSQALYIARGKSIYLEDIAFNLSFEIPPAQPSSFTKSEWHKNSTVSSNHTDFSKYKRMAVLVSSQKKQIKNLAEDLFMMDFMRQGVTVASRSDLDLVVKEMRFQQSGITDGMSVKAGKILNVSAVVIVAQKNERRGRSYVDLGYMAKVIDVETGEVIIMAGNKDTCMEGDLREYCVKRVLKGISQGVTSFF